MAPARCMFCRFEKEGKCSKKKGATVKLNKRRPCNLFQQDDGKLESFVEKKMMTSKPTVTTRPDWWWDKNLRRELRKQAAQQAEQGYDMSNFGTTIDPNIQAKHPLTGDLSRFVQGEEGNENKPNS